MELSSPELIQQLTQSPAQQNPSTNRPNVPSTVRRGSRSCECMQCRTCMDNARWERIFQEKFADPSYYQKRPVRHGSSLHGV